MARTKIEGSTTSGLPIGTVKAFAGSSIPYGTLLCDGSAVSRTTYAALFATVNTTYGVGDGSTTFNLPDLRGRIPAGKDNMGGSAANRLTTGGSGVNGVNLGAVGGTETHTLTSSQIPTHQHDMTHTHSHYFGNTPSGVVLNAAGGGGVDQRATTNTLSQSTSSTGFHGSGGVHNNTQPTLVLNYVVSYV